MHKNDRNSMTRCAQIWYIRQLKVQFKMYLFRNLGLIKEDMNGFTLGISQEMMDLLFLLSIQKHQTRYKYLCFKPKL